MLVGALLGAGVVAALGALRPVLPENARLDGREVEFGGGVDEQLRYEVERLDALEALARRKFGAIRWSVDLIFTALGVAGLGLLITFLAP